IGKPSAEPKICGRRRAVRRLYRTNDPVCLVDSVRLERRLAAAESAGRVDLLRNRVFIEKTGHSDVVAVGIGSTVVSGHVSAGINAGALFDRRGQSSATSIGGHGDRNGAGPKPGVRHVLAPAARPRSVEFVQDRACVVYPYRECRRTRWYNGGRLP